MRRAVIVVFALALASCQARSACPTAYHLDRAREARLATLLARDPETRALLDENRGTQVMCFAPGGTGVIAGDTLLLDQAADEAHLAARTAHLLAHRARKARATSGDPRNADEKDARAVERRVLARAGALAPPPSE